MAVGALNIEPGDEIILPTWTMSACSTSIILWNAIPVFVDISEDDFCIDPDLIEKKITKKTKAIMAVDIFGNQCKINKIKKSQKNIILKLLQTQLNLQVQNIKINFLGL